MFSQICPVSPAAPPYTSQVIISPHAPIIEDMQKNNNLPTISCLVLKSAIIENNFLKLENAKPQVELLLP